MIGRRSWTSRIFIGDFYRTMVPGTAGPCIFSSGLNSLCHVRSRLLKRPPPESVKRVWWVKSKISAASAGTSQMTTSGQCANWRWKQIGEIQTQRSLHFRSSSKLGDFRDSRSYSLLSLGFEGYQSIRLDSGTIR